MPAGISATLLLVLMAYVGWWYQRHLRARFYEMVSRIDEDFEGGPLKNDWVIEQDGGGRQEEERLENGGKDAVSQEREV
jgi:hypothetical protein